MTFRPEPARRYEQDSLQAAYASGFQQMYDHDSFAFKDRMEGMVKLTIPPEDLEADPELRAEGMAAALEGAAEALRALAEQAREGARFGRAIGLR
jgi:hypothetical protein